MKKLSLFILAGLFVASSSAFAEKVKDWKDLDKVHKHVQEALKEMDRARAANHYDMDGHGAKAEEALHNAEKELSDAVASAKSAK
jgi:hypothetical protein